VLRFRFFPWEEAKEAGVAYEYVCIKLPSHIGLPTMHDRPREMVAFDAATAAYAPFRVMT
jgi:hypothetical protein